MKLLRHTFDHVRGHAVDPSSAGWVLVTQTSGNPKNFYYPVQELKEEQEGGRTDRRH